MKKTKTKHKREYMANPRHLYSSVIGYVSATAETCYTLAVCRAPVFSRFTCLPKRMIIVVTLEAVSYSQNYYYSVAGLRMIIGQPCAYFFYSIFFSSTGISLRTMPRGRVGAQLQCPWRESGRGLRHHACRILAVWRDWTIQLESVLGRVATRRTCETHPDEL